MPKVRKKTKSKPVKENIINGVMLSLVAIPVGIAIWLFLWNFGFISSIAAFAIAYLAGKLYKKGAGTITKKSIKYISAVTIIGIILAFFSGMIADALVEYANLGKVQPDLVDLLSLNFWLFVGDNITTVQLWSAYAVEIVITIVFAAMGAGTTIYDIHKETSE